MTKEQIQLLIQRGHITPETGRRMVQHYAEGGVVAMPLKAPKPPQPQQPTFEQTLTEMSPIAGAGYGLVKNLIFDQRPPGEFEPGGGGITESMSPIDLVTPTMVAAPVRAVAGGIGKGAIQGAKAIQQGILARGNVGSIEVGIGKKAPKVVSLQAETLKSASGISREQFNEMAARGKLNPATGVALPEEKLTKTPVGMGLVNNYPIEDIAHFYSKRMGGHPSAYDEFIADVARESQNKKLLSSLGKQKPAQSAPKPTQEVTRPAYQGEHQAPGPDNAPIHDLVNSGAYPEDVYSMDAARLYGHGDEAMDRESMSILQSVKDKPNATVKIYRAVPKKTSNLEKAQILDDQMRAYLRRGNMPKDAKFSNGSDWFNWAFEERARLRALPEETIEQIKSVNPGDWVTLSKKYAKDHGESALNGEYKIVSKTVKAKELFTDSNSIHELGYWPASKKATGAAIGGIGILGGASQAQASQGEKAMFTKEQADMMLQRGLITPQTYQRITGAQGYAEGGEVMPAPLPTPAEEIPSTPISVNVGAPTIPEQFATMPAPMPAPTPIPQMTPAGAAGVPLPGQYGPPSPMAQTPPATERAIVPGMPAAPAGFQMPGEASMMKAAGLEAQAAQQIGTAAEKAFEGLQAQMETERKTYQSIQSDIQARLKTLDGELMGGQVNPNRVWSEAGTGAKIGAVLGMLFSGIGAGVTGKENLAVANINKMIDRDIEVQKANIQNKQNLFSKYLTQLGDARQAEAASRLHLVQAAEVQVKQAQAKAATPQAQAAFEKTRAQLEQQKAQYTIELTKMMGNASLYGMGGSEGGIPFGRESFYQASDPELQKRIVPVADKQRSYLARSDQEAADLRKMEAAYSKARKMLNQLKQYSSIGARLDPQQRQSADAIVAKLPPLLNELNGYARFTEMEQELLEKTFTAPGVLNAMFAPNTKTNALLKDLDTQMQNKRAIMLQGYKPVTTFEPGAK